MKKLLLILLALFAVTALTACEETKDEDPKTGDTDGDNNTDGDNDSDANLEVVGIEVELDAAKEIFKFLEARNLYKENTTSGDFELTTDSKATDKLGAFPGNIDAKLDELAFGLEFIDYVDEFYKTAAVNTEVTKVEVADLDADLMEIRTTEIYDTGVFPIDSYYKAVYGTTEIFVGIVVDEDTTTKDGKKIFSYAVRAFGIKTTPATTPAE